MSDTTTQTPTSAAPATTAAISDIEADIALIKKLIAANKAGGLAAVVANAPEVIAEVEKNVADVTAAIPEAKTGWKTSEFWVAVGVAVAGIAYHLLTGGKDLPSNITAAITAVATIYIAARTLLKAKQVAAAATAAASTAKP